METLTEPRPEALEWVESCLQEQTAGGMERDEACRVEHSRSDTGTVSQGNSGFLCTSSGLSSSILCSLLISHMPCLWLPMPWADSPWSITASLWSLRTQSEAEAAVEVVGARKSSSTQRPLCLLYHTHVRPLTPPVDHTIATHAVIAALF